MKLAMARYDAEIMVGPKEKGTGNAMWFIGGLHSWGNAVPVGGSGALSVALEACVKDTGGTVRVSSPVKSVKVEGGVATGIVLESGEEILASRAVISNVNVKQLFLEMVAEDRLPAGFRDKVARIKPASFSGLNQALALNEAPKYKAGSDVSNTFFVEYAPSSMEEILRIFEEFEHGVDSAEIVHKSDNYDDCAAADDPGEGLTIPMNEVLEDARSPAGLGEAHGASQGNRYGNEDPEPAKKGHRRIVGLVAVRAVDGSQALRKVDQDGD